MVEDGELYDVTNCLTPTAAWAAGAMISSIHDQRIWLTALVDGSLIPPGLQKERLVFIPGAIGGQGGIPIQYGRPTSKKTANSVDRSTAEASGICHRPLLPAPPRARRSAGRTAPAARAV